MSCNGNRELELNLRIISAEAELLAKKVGQNQLWGGEAKSGVESISAKLSIIKKIVEHDRQD